MMKFLELFLVRRDSYFSPKEQLWRWFLHLPVGVGTVLAVCHVHWAAGLIIAFWFWAYERNEDRWMRDQAWVDMKGAIWGAAICSIVEAII